MDYPRKTLHFPAFLVDCNPCLLLIYYCGVSFDTPIIQEMPSCSFDGTFISLYNEVQKTRQQSK